MPHQCKPNIFSTEDLTTHRKGELGHLLILLVINHRLVRVLGQLELRVEERWEAYLLQGPGRYKRQAKEKGDA